MKGNFKKAKSKGEVLVHPSDHHVHPEHGHEHDNTADKTNPSEDTATGRSGGSNGQGFSRLPGPSGGSGPFLLPSIAEFKYYSPLQPYVTLEQDMKDDDDKIYNNLCIHFKLDGPKQKIELLKHEPAVYPNTTRIVTLRADDPEHKEDGHFYHTKMRIYKSEMKEHENMIYVTVDHRHARHGGSGSTHYPSD